MAYTQADLTSLERALATGALEVRDASGRSTRFADREDLEQRIALIKRELGQATRGGIRITLAQFDRGVR